MLLCHQPALLHDDRYLLIMTKGVCIICLWVWICSNAYLFCGLLRHVWYDLFILILLGGNPRGVFGLALVQGEWKVYVSGLLDREQQDWYLLNITASDGLYVARTAVEVTVMDANDNSPICNQVRKNTY